MASVKTEASNVKVTLTATAAYGEASAAKEFEVTVNPPDTSEYVSEARKALNNTKISKSSLALYTGRVTHTASIRPSYTSNFSGTLKAAGLTLKSVSYKSNRPKIVSVNNKGLVTGLKAGKATVTTTVTLSDGSAKALRTTVTVKKPYLKISGRSSVKKGKTLTLKVKKYGVSGTAVWSVNKAKTARIQKKTGKLTAKTAGTIKVTVKVGKVKQTCKITVKN